MKRLGLMVALMGAVVAAEMAGREGEVARGELAAPVKEIALYEGAAPGSEGWTWTERAAGSATNPTVQNVVKPVLMVYPADQGKKNGTAVIIAPGGGFQNLMMSYEGVDVAKRLNGLGVDAYVLKYRLRHMEPRARGGATQPAGRGGGGGATTTPADDPVRAMAGADGRQAVKVLRGEAGALGIKRLGFIGFSAGGAVALAAIRGPAETRPDFAALLYPSGANGDAPPAGAPPVFLAVAADDQSVGWEGSVEMFNAWRKGNVPVELHEFQTGRHGFRTLGGGGDHYFERMVEWMGSNGWVGE
jgi:dienelactone hydrolase